MNWEEVAVDTFRLEVPGGWLYRHGGAGAPSLAFVPTPESELRERIEELETKNRQLADELTIERSL